MTIEQINFKEKPSKVQKKTGAGNPWWIPVFIYGKAPILEKRLFSLLGFVSFALFFENYDYSLLSANLKFIAQDLNITESNLGYFTALIRFGSLPALFLVPMADHFGRKRLFLLCVAGSGLGTMLTAFSMTSMQFVAIQIFTRIFLLTGSAVAMVIITEEFPADYRGWGIGILSSVAAMGYAFGALLFSFIDYYPFGWRFLYFLGFLSLLILPALNRNILETHRFKQLAKQGINKSGNIIINLVRPIKNLITQYPGRAIGLLIIISLTAVGQAAVYNFTGYFVLTTHQWAPWQYSAMTIFCGAVAIPGNAFAGRLADRIGRKYVGSVLLLTFPILAWCFFQGPSQIIPFVWVIMLFNIMSTLIIMRVLGSELFPTEMRGTAAGLVSLMETIGAGVGLLTIGKLTTLYGNLPIVIPAVASITFIGGIIMFTLPETKKKELEAISR